MRKNALDSAALAHSRIVDALNRLADVRHTNGARELLSVARDDTLAAMREVEAMRKLLKRFAAMRDHHWRTDVSGGESDCALCSLCDEVEELIGGPE